MKPIVIDKIVNQDLCTGCGVCTYVCPTDSLKMGWNDSGFLVPEYTSGCDLSGKCINVCPFNPLELKGRVLKTEDELSDLYIKNEDSRFNKRIGHFINLYAGYSNEYRITSSSGGLATYIAEKLLENKIVDHIVSVRGSQGGADFFEYTVISSVKELLSTSKTKYYPVTLAEVLPLIEKLNGSVAISGIACHIKAVRLLQDEYPPLQDKIRFFIGIICGGLKSKFFTEYLIQKSAGEKVDVSSVDFRVKDLQGTAGNYSFSCQDKSDKEHSVKMRTLGDMWGTGLFKANACDFCDDVSSELCDISLGDAWIRPFVNDGRGTNVVVVRSKIASKIIDEGIYSGALNLATISEQEFINSQKGSYAHRQDAMGYRLQINRNKELPSKRFNETTLPLDAKLVQRLRLKARRESLSVWKEEGDASRFDARMKGILKFLRFITKLNHIKRGIIKLLLKK